ncbi:MAG: FeoB-associated Cys-rich membrane protein [Butyrivibrio sp.]|nr:FeoB-associated Cys-rich membrane protein [Butyrivibrio sp.]
MASIIGNGIVIIVLAILIFFSGRSALRQFKRELNGGGCSCCSGGCNGCSSCKTTGASGCNCGNK